MANIITIPRRSRPMLATVLDIFAPLCFNRTGGHQNTYIHVKDGEVVCAPNVRPAPEMVVYHSNPGSGANRTFGLQHGRYTVNTIQKTQIKLNFLGEKPADEPLDKPLFKSLEECNVSVSMSFEPYNRSEHEWKTLLYDGLYIAQARMPEDTSPDWKMIEHMVILRLWRSKWSCEATINFSSTDKTVPYHVTTGRLIYVAMPLQRKGGKIDIKHGDIYQPTKPEKETP